jgi:arsenite oxidase small subunit
MKEDTDKKQRKDFSLKDLEEFDGKEGRPFYIAFKGKIYDLSESHLWIQGKHMSIHSRDENLAETIKSAPHSEEILERFPILGNLIEERAPQPEPATAAGEEAIEKPTVKQSQSPEAIDRRNFLKLLAAAGGAVTFVTMASSLKALTFIPAGTTVLSWPKITVANIKSLSLLKPIVFTYPLDNTPNMLVKLGVAAKNGVGPDNDIVAFSDICQHLGCFYGFVPPDGSPPCNTSYKASASQGYCCCHGSRYDFVNGGSVIGGPAPRPVPQVQLEYDPSTGNINAIGMGPPTIYGHGPPGTTDPALVQQYDLQGGTVVSGS